MGITHVTVKVRSLSKAGKPYEADFLVGTGSIDCMAAREHLDAAGIVPEGKGVYELANGQPMEMEFGFARVAFMGEETVTPVIFGPKDIEPILGVLALEAMGVVVDPVSKDLKRLHAKPLK